MFRFAIVCGFGLMLAGGATGSGLQINFIYAPGMDSQAVAGFQAAAVRWEDIFWNDVTVNLNIDYADLGPGILGSTSISDEVFSYSDVRAALVSHAQSAADQTSVLHLAAAPDFGMLINHTLEDGGSGTLYVDNNHSFNNRIVDLATADAKALGLGIPSSTVDGTITLSSGFTWDFDPSNGITPGAYDFVGVATHELGHALGFYSNVDTLDYCSRHSCLATPPPYPADDFAVSALDLFRYSADSRAQGVIDFTADNRTNPKYFSIDGGATSIATFSNGTSLGDGYQASHWKRGYNIGIMDPAVSSGYLMSISSNDIEALDVIGWNTPEPGTIVLCLAGLAALAMARRKLA